MAVQAAMTVFDPTHQGPDPTLPLRQYNSKAAAAHRPHHC